MKRAEPNQADCEYIVIGSGPGGGTLAARLAESGCSVILLEAGGDPRTLAGGDAVESNVNRLPADYDVPAFHGFASENTAIKWDYFVRHYADPELERLDPNYVPARAGVLYPRASALGGCSAHNAMIFVYPHNADWDYIANLTDDASWKAGEMRRWFEKVERCGHRPLYRGLSRLGFNPTRHGWSGWLRTERALPVKLLENRTLLTTIADAALEAFLEDGEQADRVRWFVESGLDPNDWRLVRNNSTGIRYLPLTTANHARTGSRERVLDVAQRYPDRLKVLTDALATRVLFDEENSAVGVEYLEGKRLYRAHEPASESQGTPRTLMASREVILACGAFNSPQLLMLSGIGPREELGRHGIPVRVDLPGVGKNLQDRYEIGVVNRMHFREWAAYDGATFTENDPQFREWQTRRGGVYSTNGSVLTLFRRSSVANELPDLFCMSLLARFTGYYPGYSKVFAEAPNYLTWVVLKAHTRNRAGEVTLRSSDPLDPPLICFNYFKDGGDDDITAVVDGIRFVRRLSARLQIRGLIAAEEVPGTEFETDDDLKEFVRKHAWGHHASCSCAIGPRERNGVLNSAFQVHGTRGLRVVDASAFPEIPGFFIVSAVYMIGEKAAADILRDRAAQP
jgi:choline dehydrogenase